jgi:hypothetical protein
LKKVPLKLPSKTFDGAKVPFARGISVFCAREAKEKRLAGAFLLYGTPAKKVLIKLFQKFAG